MPLKNQPSILRKLLTSIIYGVGTTILVAICIVVANAIINGPGYINSPEFRSDSKTYLMLSPITALAFGFFAFLSKRKPRSD